MYMYKLIYQITQLSSVFLSLYLFKKVKNEMLLLKNDLYHALYDIQYSSQQELIKQREIEQEIECFGEEICIEKEHQEIEDVESVKKLTQQKKEHQEEKLIEDAEAVKKLTQQKKESIQVYQLIQEKESMKEYQERIIEEKELVDQLIQEQELIYQEREQQKLIKQKELIDKELIHQEKIITQQEMIKYELINKKESIRRDLFNTILPYEDIKFYTLK